MVATGKQRVNRKQSESGAVLVEFGFVLLPSMGFIFLLLGLTWVIFAWACVQEGVREGARVAVTCTPSTGLNTTIKRVVEQYSFGFVNESNAASVFAVQYLDPTTLSPMKGQVYTGDVVKVVVQGLPVYTFAPIMRGTGPLYVGASSADIMSCPAPATP